MEIPLLFSLNPRQGRTSAVWGRQRAPTRIRKVAISQCANSDQKGSGITEPVSPGLLLTETTVAFGKKLNSEALAQV